MDNRLTEPAQMAGRVADGIAATEMHSHQLELLFELVTQLLATPELDDRLRLTVEAATTRLGCACAAVALVEQRRTMLRVRTAAGFTGHAPVTNLEMPLGSTTPFASTVREGRARWIAREDDEASAAFLDRLGCPTDLLALPLFGAQPVQPKQPVEMASRLATSDRSRAVEPQCLGALYLGIERATTGDAQHDMFVRFAKHTGVSIASSLQTEHLIESVKQSQRERQWVESVMKSVADPIVLTNLDNEILLQNRRAAELFSGAGQSSAGKRRALEMNDRLFSEYLSGAAVSSTEIVGHDLTLVHPPEGSDIHFEVISTPALDARGERIGMVSIFRDVTDLRRANEKLARNFVKLQHAEAEARRERDRLDLIIENVGHPVAVCDAGGKFILFNTRAERLFQPVSASNVRTARAARAVRTNTVKLASFISMLVADAQSTGRKDEIELADPETSAPLPMEITSAEVHDATGQVTAVVSILHDLSEMRELERRRVEQQLFESEKLAAVGRLAASIAHEVNNPLEAIKNSLYLLTTSQDAASNTRFLDVARKETERVSHIIRQMLGFARRTGEIEPVNVNQVLEETLILVEKKLRQTGVAVARRFAADLPPVRARIDQLRQVFLNLILNAQQAIDGAGEISIITARHETALQPSVSIKITDSGRGISEGDIARIFDPFFSTRQKGTGLGLWVTQDIVRHHGGRIEVTSAQAKGTTFNIILPIDPPAFGEDGH